MRGLRFRTRLLLVILSVAVVAMGAVFAFAYSEMRSLSRFSQDVNAELGDFTSEHSKDALITQAESYLVRLSAVQAARYDANIEHVKNDVQGLSAFMEDMYARPGAFAATVPDQDGMPGQPTLHVHAPASAERTRQFEQDMRMVNNSYFTVRTMVLTNPAITSAYVATASGIMFEMTSEQHAHAPDYDPRTRPWYIDASEANGFVWTDVYLDAVTGAPNVTGAQAFRMPDGTLAGVAAADIPLSTVVDDLNTLRIGESGHAFLVDGDGTIIADTRFVAEDPQSMGQYAEEYGDTIALMASGESGITTATIDGDAFYIAYSALPVAGWSLGVAVATDEVVADAVVMQLAINEHADDTDAQIQQRLTRVLTYFGWMLPVVLLLVVLISASVSRSVTGPVTRLAEGVAKVGSGNLDAKIDVRSKDEIGELATSFNLMTDDLKKHAADLARVTAEKERINSDLRIATDIQNDMLPKVFPPYSDRDDVKLAAFMRPAKEVGGDFYDFFFTDEGETKIAMVIADVSGKSVPAALFMVIAKTLIKNNQDLPPAEVLGVVNDLLATDNESSMFVTTYYSVLDIDTGRYVYASAGHDPPLLYRADGRTLAYLDLPKAPPLGVFPNREYTSRELVLSPGDALLLYTDGVTEAFNGSSEMYGTERLLSDLGGLIDAPAQEAVHGIYAAIDAFADGEEQSDDITMLFCRYVGPPSDDRPERT